MNAGGYVCPTCSTVFAPRRMDSKYCSRPCMWAQNGGHNKTPEQWWINEKGYIEGRLWIEDRQVSVRKHRQVAENAMGRKLLPSEDVHHINGDKLDNRPENLAVIEHRAHSIHHNTARIVNGRAPRQGRLHITHCPKGHAYDDANTYVCPKGKRTCRACRSDARCQYLDRKRSAKS